MDTSQVWLNGARSPPRMWCPPQVHTCPAWRCGWTRRGHVVWTKSTLWVPRSHRALSRRTSRKRAPTACTSNPSVPKPPPPKTLHIQDWLLLAQSPMAAEVVELGAAGGRCLCRASSACLRRTHILINFTAPTTAPSRTLPLPILILACSTPPTTLASTRHQPLRLSQPRRRRRGRTRRKPQTCRLKQRRAPRRGATPRTVKPPLQRRRRRMTRRDEQRPLKVIVAGLWCGQPCLGGKQVEWGFLMAPVLSYATVWSTVRRGGTCL